MTSQVNTTALLEALPRLLEQTKALEELLHEVVASAGDRSLDPSPLEKSIVQSIVEERLKTVAF
jgi:hypothetical protein